MKNKWLILLFTMVIVAFIGEWRLTPFGDAFRFSLGPAVFLFLLLWNRMIHPLLMGLSVGVFIVAFRIGLDLLLRSDSITLQESFNSHFPSFFFYLFFSLFYYLFRTSHVLHKPFLVSVFGISSEILANLFELLFRFLLYDRMPTISQVEMIAFIAIIRSLSVIGFYYLIRSRQQYITKEKLKEQNDELILLISNMYEEAFQLKSSLRQIERVTNSAYELYEKVKKIENENLAKDALLLSGQIHEMKKNNQRLLAGIEFLIKDKKKTEYMPLEEISEIIRRTNRKYGFLLGKDIWIFFQIEADVKVHLFTFLTLVNNMLANSIEAIEKKGHVYIKIFHDDETLRICIMDTGPGVSPAKREAIFSPGYTTKYNSDGQASSGIGLAYVKELVEQLGGTIHVEDTPFHKGIQFVLRIPKKSICLEENTIPSELSPIILCQ